MVAFEAMRVVPEYRKPSRDDTNRVHSHVFIGDVPSFDPLSCPGGFAEKGKAGFHAGIVEETTNRDSAPHLGPTIPGDQVFDNSLQCNPVQGIARMGNNHDPMRAGISVLASV
jgi:hypothetical protein